MKNYLYLFITLFLISCSNEPEPIVYGSDSCSYCKMTIVSKAHSAQLVTKKGKQIKYDAIECLVKDNIQNYDEKEVALILVANYKEPGTMLPAKEAAYVIDEQITSPMGANLAAVKKGNEIEGISASYTWNELKNHFLKEDSQRQR
ncbi:copper-binding protein [Antarcticibacterium arcticum]|uniref:Copper-binding protein n=1 Tax=Antarcticibacterium arcticum TaxID=2585771 RepID=A0A5B8YHP2_9FLAO|nr:nitrous oxide reductase accessory protein NosL [Antarcticibacterium arcticum]QED37344.1 copper-binding protein [Antarcticibacterium arcticum]